MLKYNLGDVVGVVMQKAEEPVRRACEFGRWIIVIGMVDDYPPVPCDTGGVPPTRFGCFDQRPMVGIVFRRGEKGIEGEELICLLDFCA